MKVCVLTRRLYVVAIEQAGSSDVHREVDAARRKALESVGSEGQESAQESGYLFLGYRSFRVWLGHRLLRASSEFGWTPKWIASFALRLCEREVVEALRAHDPDVVAGLSLRWIGQLGVFLKNRCPEWLVVTDSAEGLRVRPRSPLDPGARVSIVLPTYNGTRYLAQAIESCLAQSFRDVELIVVDDGSRPDVRAVVEPYLSDSRVKYVRHEKNAGVAASLNTGFRIATGSHLTWTSDDNYFEPEAIAEMLRFMQRYPDVDFVFAESYEVDEGGAINRLMRTAPAAALKVNNFVGACFLYKRLVYERVGEYRPIFLTEDYDYWIRVSRVSVMQRLFKPLYHYRAHPASLTGRYSPEEVDARVTHVKRMNRFGSRKNR